MTDALYPFLTGDPIADTTGDPDLLADLRQSAAGKASEVIELRRRVVGRDATRIEACAADLAAAFAAGARLLAFGNGGSSTDALDLASLFLSAGNGSAGSDTAGSDTAGNGGTGSGGAGDGTGNGGSGRALPAFALAGDVALVTALSNDVGFDAVFARQIAALGRRGDIAVGLSTSGNSPNLLNAFDEAHARGLLTVGIAGGDGGRMAGLSTIDHLFVVASPSVHRIQEAQTTIYHVLWELTLAALAAGNGVRATTGIGGALR
ncbi:D-sedoheptulose-7-phosphate isomerase [Rugosimonospora africana]|uniref:Phosphoheptose isomerase n=1 Tax=Rugosimonospora africana TaxID=556532 RepID=A0A8J3QQP5_9ACTN|nr:SIS domain-containing protein [Rugosimonospora africana]GIH14776.1 phosphoheptose isomerase [Rugosimonospora africana]